MSILRDFPVNCTMFERFGVIHVVTAVITAGSESSTILDGLLYDRTRALHMQVNRLQ
jgi:hypothetical protein